EVSRANVLDDEIVPGRSSYGNDYRITVQLAKGHGVIGRELANFHNRVVANLFNLGANHLLQPFIRADQPRDILQSFQKSASATTQAEEIGNLPMLAGALLPSRELPWNNNKPLLPGDWAGATASLGITLTRMQLANTNTHLIPTAPETSTERYVDTVKEAILIQLAVSLKELNLAKEVLDFYWEKSQGGSNALHSSYDAKTGAALIADATFERPRVAKRTAEAQLAIADAAFSVFVESGYSNAFTLGKNLTSVVLREFRAPENQKERPRGITEYRVYPATNKMEFLGTTLWPEPARYTLRSN